MIGILVTAAAVALSGIISSPELLNESRTITPDDYPQQMLRANKSAFEDIRIVVGPSGNPETCNVIGEVRTRNDVGANKEVGRLSCDLMMRRAKFRPAVGIDGLPSYGTYSAWISWQVGEDFSYRQPEQVDGDISVAVLPKGMPDPALIDVDIAVAADGTPGTCSAAPKGKQASPLQVISPSLAAVACSQLVGSGRLNPARSQSGNLVPSVQGLVMRFSTAKVTPAPVQDPK